MNSITFPSNNLTPEVGMAATICMVTDRHPCTVVALEHSKWSGKLKAVRIAENDFKVVKGSEHDGSAEYEYTPVDMTKVKPEECQKFTLRRTGHWIRDGEPLKGGTRLVLGTRERYYDPHF